MFILNPSLKDLRNPIDCHINNIIYFWAAKINKWNQFHLLIQIWKNEVLLYFRENNTHIVLHSARKQDPIHRHHLLLTTKYKILKNSSVSTLSLAFQAGRLGFVKNQKKSFIAASSVLTSIFWVIKRHQAAITPVQIRLVGDVNHLHKHEQQINKFLADIDQPIIHSYLESTPVSFGTRRFKALSRTRYRYHLYNFSAAVIRKNNMVF